MPANLNNQGKVKQPIILIKEYWSETNYYVKNVIASSPTSSKQGFIGDETIKIKIKS